MTMQPLGRTRSPSDRLRGAVEPELRRLVADQLGVSPEELAPEVSLTDDLAADSLDLAELGVLLETAWPVAIPAAALAALRTYGELVDVLVSALSASRRGASRAALAAVFARARIVPGASRGRRSVERAGRLTPYAVEVLVEDVLRAGPGARLEMEVTAATDDDGLAATRERFAWLAARGVAVSVRRHGWTPYAVPETARG